MPSHRRNADADGVEHGDGVTPFESKVVDSVLERRDEAKVRIDGGVGS
jgi:hypothetical protein